MKVVVAVLALMLLAPAAARAGTIGLAVQPDRVEEVDFVVAAAGQGSAGERLRDDQAGRRGRMRLQLLHGRRRDHRLLRRGRRGRVRGVRHGRRR